MVLQTAAVAVGTFIGGVRLSKARTLPCLFSRGDTRSARALPERKRGKMTPSFLSTVPHRSSALAVRHISISVYSVQAPVDSFVCSCFYFLPGCSNLKSATSTRGMPSFPRKPSSAGSLRPLVTHTPFHREQAADWIAGIKTLRVVVELVLRRTNGSPR